MSTVSEPSQEAPSPASPAVESLLGTDGRRRPWQRPMLWWVLGVLAVASGVVGWWQASRQDAGQPRYLTETVKRGRLVVTVTANGTIQPTTKVDIGSELSGTVERVAVDVNDRVKKGQLLAVLDTDKLSGQARRSGAALQVARARLDQARATVAEARGNVRRLEEVARLSGGKVPSQAELAAGQAALARALADEASANASVTDARAARDVDQTNLRKASIRSPIDGVVLSRSVDPGNAVAASLQAVTLFTLAEDLSQMKLKVDVDEADVGQVHEGQQARFTVSAHANRQFPATITRVGFGSTTKDNVVTYLTELTVTNADLSLRPGMTATAVITTSERDNALLVPNSALRYTPAMADGPPAANGGLVSKLVPRLPRQATRRAGTNIAAARQVWVLRDGRAVPIEVTPGASDGRVTEVVDGALQPGMQVIVEQTTGSPP